MELDIILITCVCLSSSSWSELSTDDPLSQLQGTFFFRVVEEGYNAGLHIIMRFAYNYVADVGLLSVKKRSGTMRDMCHYWDIIFSGRLAVELFGRLQYTCLICIIM